MDPTECLARITYAVEGVTLASLSDARAAVLAHLDDLHEATADLAAWINSGGFLPEPGRTTYVR